MRLKRCFRKRIRKLKLLLQKTDTDALLLINLRSSSLDPSIYYFSGVRFLTYAVLLIPCRENPLLIVSKGSYERAGRFFDNVMKTENLKRDLRNIFKELDVKTLGVNTRFFTLEMKKIVGKCKIRDFSEQIYRMRMVKDESEIRLIKKAVSITKRAIDETLEWVKAGMSENRVKAKLEYIMKNEGADDFSFPTIVVSGKKTADPHGITSRKKIRSGELLLIDCGAKYKEYCADITRISCLGKLSKQQKEVYDVVVEARKIGIRNAKPGMTNYEVDSIVRSVIKEYGYDIPHGVGHGIGLEIHEEPSIAYKGYKNTKKVKLKRNMIFTIEPGIYLTKKFGIRVEDDVLITDNGCKLL